jgi:hypothetical protein
MAITAGFNAGSNEKLRRTTSLPYFLIINCRILSACWGIADSFVSKKRQLRVKKKGLLESSPFILDRWLSDSRCTS